MTLKGAVKELEAMEQDEAVPFYYRHILKEVIHTIKTDAIECPGVVLYTINGPTNPVELIFNQEARPIDLVDEESNEILL